MNRKGFICDHFSPMGPLASSEYVEECSICVNCYEWGCWEWENVHDYHDPSRFVEEKIAERDARDKRNEMAERRMQEDKLASKTSACHSSRCGRNRWSRARATLATWGDSGGGRRNWRSKK